MPEPPIPELATRPVRSFRRLLTRDLYVYSLFLIVAVLLVLAHKLGLT
jgi:hypothetical protein